MRGSRPGVGFRGGQMANDGGEAPHGWRSFRRGVTSSGRTTAEAAHVAGLIDSTAVGNLSLGSWQPQTAANDKLLAIPEVFPKAGRVRRLGSFSSGSANPVGLVRFGLYRNLGADDTYPGDRVADTGPFTLNAGTQLLTEVADVSVSAGELLWFVVLCNAAALGHILHGLIDGFGLPPILGQPLGVTLAEVAAFGDARRGVGWYHAQAYGELPALFPRTAPEQLIAGAGGNMPALWFTWQGD